MQAQVTEADFEVIKQLEAIRMGVADTNTYNVPLACARGDRGLGVRSR
jgi:hypothetical protein